MQELAALHSFLHSILLLYSANPTEPPLRFHPTHNPRSKLPFRPRVVIVVPSSVPRPPLVPLPQSRQQHLPRWIMKIFRTSGVGPSSTWTTPMSGHTYVCQACIPVLPGRLYHMDHTNLLQMCTVSQVWQRGRSKLSRSMKVDSLPRNHLLNMWLIALTTVFTVKFKFWVFEVRNVAYEFYDCWVGLGDGGWQKIDRSDEWLPTIWISSFLMVNVSDCLPQNYW